MKLSKNFYLSELIKSNTADRLGIINIPTNQDIIDNLRAVTENILQPVRDHFGIAFSPTSGYRCLELNRATPGSKDTSQHIKGEAVDFEIPGVTNLEIYYWIKDNLDFDQLILEYYKKDVPNSGWCHCSYKKSGNRNQAISLG